MSLQKLLTSLTFTGIASAGLYYCVKQIPQGTFDEPIQRYLPLLPLVIGGPAALVLIRRYITSEDNPVSSDNSSPSSPPQRYKKRVKEGYDKRGKHYRRIKEDKW